MPTFHSFCRFFPSLKRILNINPLLAQPSLQLLVLILDLGWFKHPRNLHRRLSFFLGFPLCFGLFLFKEKFGIVARKLLELNQEVTKS